MVVAVESARLPTRIATSTASFTRSCGWSPIRTSICRSGCIAAKGASRGISSRTAMLLGALIRSKPRRLPPPRTPCSASSRAASTASIRSRNSSPESVNLTARVVRERSLAPRSASRSEMIRETCDCERSHSRAATEKLPSRATRVNTFNEWRSFKTGSGLSRFGWSRSPVLSPVRLECYLVATSRARDLHLRLIATLSR